jgi:hypothetical protein
MRVPRIVPMAHTSAPNETFQREPAREHLFRPQWIGRPPQTLEIVPGQFVLSSRDTPANICRRSEHFEIPLSEMPDFSIELGTMAFLNGSRGGADVHARSLFRDSLRRPTAGRGVEPMACAKARRDHANTKDSSESCASSVGMLLGRNYPA